MHRCLVSAVLLITLTSCITVRDPDRRLQGHLIIPSNADLFVRGTYHLAPLSTRAKSELHNNEELDLSSRRPVVALAGTVFETKYGKPGYQLVGNLYHRGHFFIARIPAQAVQNVYYQLAYVPGPVGVKPHSVLRFEFPFEMPIELVAHMPDESRLEKLRDLHPEQILEAMPAPLQGDEFDLHNIAVSAEPQWSKKDSAPGFDAQRVDLGAYVEIIRLVSMEVRFEDFFATGGYVSQIKLGVKAGQGDRLLAAALLTSQREGLSKPFDSATLNGATVALDVLNSVLSGNNHVRAIASWVKSKRANHAARRVDNIRTYLTEAGGGAELKEHPMQLDRSLAQEAHAAFEESVVSTHRDVCPIAMAREICQSISQAVRYYHLPLN